MSDPYEHYPQHRPMPHPGTGGDGFGNWCPDCGERRDLCQCGFPPRVGIWDFESEVYEWDWNDVDWPDEDQDEYDYTEGDIGQDGEI